MTSEDAVDSAAQDYEDPERAVYYALEHADIPLTEEQLLERPETDGHDAEAVREGIEDWNLETVDYDGVTAYHLGKEMHTNVTIDREMYEELREKSSYIGEDPHGVNVHLSEDFRSLGKVKHPDDTPKMDAWAPLFPANDDEVDQTDTVTDHASKTVLLEATTDDIVEITDVHSGMRRVPEKMRVVRRTNTYHGPSIRLIPPEDWPGDRTNYELTCPDRFSRLVLWRAVTDHEGFIHKWTKVARVSAEIRNVAGYDFCEACGEPIKDPMHRSLALTGQCPGGMNE